MRPTWFLRRTQELLPASGLWIGVKHLTPSGSSAVPTNWRCCAAGCWRRAVNLWWCWASAASARPAWQQRWPSRWHPTSSGCTGAACATRQPQASGSPAPSVSFRISTRYLHQASRSGSPRCCNWCEPGGACWCSTTQRRCSRLASRRAAIELGWMRMASCCRQLEKLRTRAA
jgi:hypothetical protein